MSEKGTKYLSMKYQGMLSFRYIRFVSPMLVSGFFSKVEKYNDI